MDNFGGAAPVLINQVKLAVGADFDINDHSTDNPAGYTGPEFDNQGTGTVTIGGAFNLNADAVVHNAGSITVNGKMEALDQSTVQNSGTIKLAGGGDFGGQSTISNTIAGALIEVSGGTLNVDVDISNLGTVKIDPAAALTLSSADDRRWHRHQQRHADAQRRRGREERHARQFRPDQRQWDAATRWTTSRSPTPVASRCWRSAR